MFTSQLHSQVSDILFAMMYRVMVKYSQEIKHFLWLKVHGPVMKRHGINRLKIYIHICMQIELRSSVNCTSIALILNSLLHAILYIHTPVEATQVISQLPSKHSAQHIALASLQILLQLDHQVLSPHLEPGL